MRAVWGVVMDIGPGRSADPVSYDKDGEGSGHLSGEWGRRCQALDAPCSAWGAAANGLAAARIAPDWPREPSCQGKALFSRELGLAPPRGLSLGAGDIKP